MLRVLRLGRPKDIWAHFDRIDFSKTTWIVSDIHSKILLQNKLFENQSVVHDEQILRVQELWRKLFAIEYPDKKIISNDAALVWIETEFRDDPILGRPGVANLVIQYVSQLLPLFLHENGRTVAEDFFSRNPDRNAQWGFWFDTSYSIWEKIQPQNWVISDWITGLLLQKSELSWNQDLVFDLSSQILSPEVELIKALSRKKEVKVCVPDPIWKSEFEWLFKPYFDMGFVSSNSEPEKHSLEAKFVRVPSYLAEVKAAVTILRDAVDAGVAPSDIVITAPDVALYAPMLDRYLTDEGIPFRMSRKTSYMTLPRVQKKLSFLKILLASPNSDVQVGEIETALFPEMGADYGKFRALFNRMLDRSDISRDNQVAQKFQTEPSLSMTRDKFVSWIVKNWGEVDGELDALISQFLQSTVEFDAFSAANWLKIFEHITCRKDLDEDLPGMDGVSILNVESAKELSPKITIALGMTENQLVPASKLMTQDTDAYLFAKDYGFNLNLPSENCLEFDLRWFAENGQTTYYLCAETDYEGNALTISPFWLEGCLKKYKNPKGEIIPFNTRHDSFQVSRNALCEAKTWDLKRYEEVESQVMRDLGHKEALNYPFRPAKVSATALEEYAQCGFKYAAKRILHLQDLPEMDLDLDFMTRGRLIHEVFKIITAEPRRFIWSDEELANIVDQVKNELEIDLAVSELWGSYRSRYVEIAKRFLAFEASWCGRFPQVKTVYREAEIKGEMDPQSGRFGKGIPFFGKVDRVDVGPDGHAILLDYKFSGGGKNHYSRWISECEFQLGIYAMALEEGLIGEKLEVDSAVYFAVRELNRHVGLVLEDTKWTEVRPRMGHRIQAERKKELFSEIQSRISEIFKNMNEGHFEARPFDHEICDRCQWKRICRAHHLNM